MITRHAQALCCHTLLAALLSLALVACDPASDPNLEGMQDGGSSTPNSGGSGGDEGDGPPADGGSHGNTIEPGGSGGTGTSMSGRDGGASEPTTTLPDQVCSGAGTCLEVAASGVDEIDMLFMVDNSGSMREEQAALRAQFPALVRALTTGDLDGDGMAEAPGVQSLHLGVVSSDMGLVGITGIERCDGLGDDGVLNNVPSPEVVGCAASYPRFLTYTAGVNDPSTTANDFACIATLGTDGCGFEQQLESTLKAVWPADDNRVLFLPDPQGFGAVGQGDNGGMNAGFLRNDPTEGLSAIVVVLVTDEEDCSSSNTSHFRSPAYLDPSNPDDMQLMQQGLNTRCHFNPQNLYTKERYINGLKALRPGNEHLVLFGAIVGVPPDAVAEIPSDYATSETARSAFYDGILSHPMMQATIDDLGTPSTDDDNIRPSCDTDNGKAYPPRRIVEVAQGFGENGMVQSICQEDFSPAIEAIAARISARLGASCLPRPLVRRADGTVGCELRWALPSLGQASVGAPTACSALPFLTEVQGATTASGGAVCAVDQLAVSSDAAPSGSGWYYDDFSDEAAEACTGRSPARITFSPDAVPPSSVRAFLDCDQ